MKTICLALLCVFLSIGSGRAQQLRGGFATTFFIGSHRYWFGDGHFQETRATCTSHFYGSGTYQLNGNSLILHYETWTKPPALKPLPLLEPTTDSTGTMTFYVPLQFEPGSIHNRAPSGERVVLLLKRRTRRFLVIAGTSPAGYYKAMEAAERKRFFADYKEYSAMP